MNSQLNAAIALACKAHAGQVDKSGNPYILHPLRVMMRFQDGEKMIISVLHDVVEDSEITLDELRHLGFSPTVIAAIDCLSKKPGESFPQFIRRLSSNEPAREVKIQDIKDNLDVTRLHSVNDEDLARIAKYHNALRYLLQYPSSESSGLYC